MKLLNPEFDLKSYLSETRELVNEHLEIILSEFDEERELIQAVRHSLMSGGKRLRPILSLAAVHACGADFRLALPVACAIEMIHTYSLIHDDLPAMDDDDLRRGQATCHKKFSEATAILAGDALLTHAFKVLACAKDFPYSSDVAPENLLLLVSKLSVAAGMNGMVEGQMMDMQSTVPVENFSREEKLEYLKRLQDLKTGKMIQISVEAGALLAGASPQSSIDLSEYAKTVGLGFQVMDDILDVYGDEKTMGKTPGSDLAMSKFTFPFLLGTSESRDFAEKLTQKAFYCLESFDEKADPLRAIAWYITHRDK